LGNRSARLCRDRFSVGNFSGTVCFCRPQREKLLLLKVLAVTSNYHVPANIENLECKTCAVIGNGFVIKNSSLGSVINKYDIVIR
ncbi:CMP-N-acetylneuraminate-beta-galactosamide-alpha-2,3-sialyltransferase 4, partial [Characodon lateralis]|nr:CMP-N-acetylneuraminate-beta-galactosamide-alpha-2,3-sialyltransferase 4 [Characodon lateralis]